MPPPVRPRTDAPRTDLDPHVCHNPRRALAAIPRPRAVRVSGRDRTYEMSRRHRERGHGRSHRSDATHGGLSRHVPAPPLQGPAPSVQGPAPSLQRPAPPLQGPASPPPGPVSPPPGPVSPPLGLAASPSPLAAPLQAPVVVPSSGPVVAGERFASDAAPVEGTPDPASGGEQAGPNARLNGGSCTPAQLRRFIKSRAWVRSEERRVGKECRSRW